MKDIVETTTNHTCNYEKEMNDRIESFLEWVEKIIKSERK